MKSEKINSKLITDNSQIWNNPNNNQKVEIIRSRLQSNILRILGPCALQNAEQAIALILAMSNSADLLRVPALKPRTNRFDASGEMGYTGVGIKAGLEIYRQLNELNTGVGIATEVMSADHLRSLAPEVQLAWIGSRTQDQYLLEGIGAAATETQTPIMIKNAMVPDIAFDIGRINNVIWGINQESEKLGLPPVPIILCLRGNHPGNTSSQYRNIPNWNAIDIFKQEFPYLPIIIDPSHILKNDNLNPEAILQLLIDAFNRKTGLEPDGYIVEVHHTQHPSLTDPGVEVQAMIKLLSDLQGTNL